MKRTILLTIICLFCSAIAAQAQSGRAVNSLFGGRFKDRTDVEEVLIRGSELKAHNLTLFRSLSVESQCLSIVREMEKCVLADSKKTENSSMKWQNRHLKFCILSFPLADGNFAHIFFKNNGKTTKLIYCEGKATLSQLKGSMMTKKTMFTEL